MLLQIDSSRVIDTIWFIIINARRFANGKGSIVVTKKDIIVAQ